MNKLNRPNSPATQIQTPFRANDIKKLEKEVRLLKSFVIGFAGKDKEGAYHPQFVKRTLKALAQRPVYTFTNADSFLTELRQISA